MNRKLNKSFKKILNKHYEKYIEDLLDTQNIEDLLPTMKKIKEINAPAYF